MQEIEHKKGKIYYSMGEVAEMFDVRPSLLRFWEQEFDILRPHRNKKGNRLFTPQDVDNVKIIYHLLKERKMKIEVARKYIKDYKKEVDQDAEIVERLMSVRAMLQQIKDEMLTGPADENDETEGAETIVVSAKKSSGKVEEIYNEGSYSRDYAVEYTTFSQIMDERDDSGEKPPFEEQMLFQVVTEGNMNVSQDMMIDSFIAKNYDVEGDEQQPEYDPFEGLSNADSQWESESLGDNVLSAKPRIIEQTLF